MKLRTVIETITPERARKLLERVRNVRATRREHVVILADAMRSRTWELNGTTIKISPDGYVVDGEHRLRACVLADVPFTTLVVYGVDQSPTIDTATRPRTAAQVVGGKNASIIAATARLAVLLERDGTFHRLDYHAIRCGITVQIIAAFAAQHSEALSVAAALSRGPGAATGLPSGAFGLVAFRAPHHDRLEAFLTGVRTGEGLRRGNPAYALRERALNVGRSARIDHITGCALVFKCWNAFANGTSVMVAKLGPGEAVCTPIGGDA